jgi:hypothetical protein
MIFRGFGLYYCGSIPQYNKTINCRKKSDLVLKIIVLSRLCLATTFLHSIINVTILFILAHIVNMVFHSTRYPWHITYFLSTALPTVDLQFECCDASRHHKNYMIVLQVI